MKTKEFITKYYWIILLFLSFGAGLLLMWFFRPSDTKDDFNRIKAEKEVLVKKHLADSVFFVRKADSLATIIGNTQSGVIHQGSRDRASEGLKSSQNARGG
jgi:hypothetical protein